MDNYNPELPGNKKDPTKLLKRLRIAFFIWLICLFAFVAWFFFLAEG